jgi:hypothetical protein
MIKRLIAPLQKLLMQKRICPACTRPLNKARVIGKVDGRNVVACKCGRVFVYDHQKLSYQRALQSDLEQMISLKAGNEYLGKSK